MDQRARALAQQRRHVQFGLQAVGAGHAHPLAGGRLARQLTGQLANKSRKMSILMAVGSSSHSWDKQETNINSTAQCTKTLRRIYNIPDDFATDGQTARRIPHSHLESHTSNHNKEDDNECDTEQDGGMEKWK